MFVEQKYHWAEFAIHEKMIHCKKVELNTSIYYKFVKQIYVNYFEENSFNF
jgi:hypothetical protein